MSNLLEVKKQALAELEDNIAAAIKVRDEFAQTISEASIQSELERLSQMHPGVPLSPRDRVRRDIAKFKKNVGKLECEIILDDQDRARLTKHQLESFDKAELERKKPLHVEVPSCFASTTQFEGRSIAMEIEVRK